MCGASYEKRRGVGAGTDLHAVRLIPDHIWAKISLTQTPVCHPNKHIARAGEPQVGRVRGTFFPGPRPTRTRQSVTRYAVATTSSTDSGPAMTLSPTRLVPGRFLLVA